MTRMTATPSRILKWAGQGGIPGGTVGVTAPTAPVRGLFAPVRGDARNGAHGRTVDGSSPQSCLERRMRWSAACTSAGGERSVKPSAQPTLVRTQHLPPPAKTAPGCGNPSRGPFPYCHAMYHDRSLWVDASRCPRTNSGRRPGRQDGRCAPSAFPRTATDRVRGVPILTSCAALSQALAQGRECRGCPVCQEGSGACVPICCRG